MIRNMTCIGCPMGCDLRVKVENGEAKTVEGNTCGIGKKYAIEEIAAPKRMVTSTMKSSNGVPVPVKTQSSIPKDKIFAVVKEIKKAEISLPICIGDVVINNVADTGVRVIATKNIGV